MLAKLFIVFSLSCCLSNVRIKPHTLHVTEYSDLVIMGCEDEILADLYTKSKKYAELTHLEISECSEVEFLPDVTAFKNLNYLAFYWNGGDGIDHIGFLFEQIASLTNLDTLVLGPYNNFTEIPCSMQSLKRLKYIDLHSTSLQVFPSVFADCPKLEYLDLSMTKVRKIEIKPGQFGVLKVLNIQETPASKDKDIVEEIRRNLPHCKIVL